MPLTVARFPRRFGLFDAARFGRSGPLYVIVRHLAVINALEQTISDVESWFGPVMRGIMNTYFWLATAKAEADDPSLLRRLRRFAYVGQSESPPYKAVLATT